MDDEDQHWSSSGPPREVLTAFGVRQADPHRLEGGQGEAWQAGSIVLKPAGDPVETAWRAQVLEHLTSTSDSGIATSVRVAEPVRTSEGGLIAGGYEAWHLVTGKEDPSRPDDVLRAGAAFHRAIADVAPPSFLATRDGPWAHGDRMAWEEVAATASEATESLLAPLLSCRRPVDLPSQLVHGDLLGNVLFADGHPPAIIDWPAYYRPAPWAAATVVCDALCWHGATFDLPERWSQLPEWPQMLVRALIYRIATDDAISPEGPPSKVIDAYRPVVEYVTNRCRSERRG